MQFLYSVSSISPFPFSVFRFPLYSLFCLEPCPQMIRSSEQMGLIHRYVHITGPRLYEYTLHIQYVTSNLLADQTRMYLLNVLSIAVKPFFRVDKPFFSFNFYYWKDRHQFLVLVMLQYFEKYLHHKKDRNFYSRQTFVLVNWYYLEQVETCLQCTRIGWEPA